MNQAGGTSVTLFSINFCLSLVDAVKRYNIHNFPLFLLEFLLVFQDYLNCTLLKLSEDLQKIPKIKSNGVLLLSFIVAICLCLGPLTNLQLFEVKWGRTHPQLRWTPWTIREINTDRETRNGYSSSASKCGYKQAVWGMQEEVTGLSHHSTTLQLRIYRRQA